MIRIEYYNDWSPSSRAWEFLRWRIQQRKFETFATVVLDSFTFCELLAKKYLESTGTPSKQIPIALTDAMEDTVLVHLCGLSTSNLLVLAHIEVERDEVNGTMIYQVAAPGRLRKRKLLAATFAETYRVYIAKDGTRLLQTVASDTYTAQSQISPPDPCAPTYAALWAGREPRPVHALVYGDPGGGKTTFAATWAVAGPVLVLSCDSTGKENPYRAGAAKVERGKDDMGVAFEEITHKTKEDEA